MPDYEHLIEQVVDSIINMDVCEMEKHLNGTISMEEYHSIKEDARGFKKFLIQKRFEKPQFCN